MIRAFTSKFHSTIKNCLLFRGIVGYRSRVSALAFIRP